MSWYLKLKKINYYSKCPQINKTSDEIITTKIKVDLKLAMELYQYVQSDGTLDLEFIKKKYDRNINPKFRYQEILEGKLEKDIRCEFENDMLNIANINLGNYNKYKNWSDYVKFNSKNTLKLPKISNRRSKSNNKTLNKEATYTIYG